MKAEPQSCTYTWDDGGILQTSGLPEAVAHEAAQAVVRARAALHKAERRGETPKDVGIPEPGHQSGLAQFDIPAFSQTAETEAAIQESARKKRLAEWKPNMADYEATLMEHPGKHTLTSATALVLGVSTDQVLLRICAAKKLTLSTGGCVTHSKAERDECRALRSWLERRFSDAMASIRDRPGWAAIELTRAHQNMEKTVDIHPLLPSTNVEEEQAHAQQDS